MTNTFPALKCPNCGMADGLYIDGELFKVGIDVLCRHCGYSFAGRMVTETQVLAEAVKDLASAFAAALQPLVVSINELVNAVTEFRIEVVTKLSQQSEP